MNKIVVWVKPNGDYYHRIVRGYYATYEKDYINQYGHKVVHVIDNLYFDRPPKIPIKIRLKRKLIDYINKM